MQQKCIFDYNNLEQQTLYRIISEGQDTDPTKFGPDSDPQQ
jgi:hypothetical protein